MTTIKTVGIAGTGLIGAGWAARLLIRGINVIAYDVHPAAEVKLRAAVKDRRSELQADAAKAQAREDSKNLGKPG